MKALLRDPDGNARLWWHTQNLSKGRGMWKHGRARLQGGQRALHTEWVLAHWHSFVVDFTVRHFDDRWSLTLAIPRLFWWHVGYEDGKCWFDVEREISLRISDGLVYWRVWSPVDSWDRSIPRWKHGSWYPLDTLLGRERYRKALVETGQTSVPMPERDYPAEYSIYDVTVSRTRWPWPRRYTRIDLEMIVPIPEPGKGENGWDMDDDALYASTGHRDSTVEEAVERVRKSVLERRRRYAGPHWVPKEAEA